MVTNVTGKTVDLTMLASKTHDFVLRSNGSVVWRASEGMFYTLALKNERFLPGETKTYESAIPYIASGHFAVDGYFTGALRPESPVLSANILIPYAQNPLGYQVLFGGTQAEPRLALRAQNTKDSDVLFPKGHTYRFVVRDRSGEVVLDRNVSNSPELSGETISKGQTVTYTLGLKGLSKGSYTAEVILRQNSQDLSRVGSTSFSIR